MPAIIYPERLPADTAAATFPDSEKKVRGALEPIDGLWVFQNVACHGRDSCGAVTDNEIDLVLLVPPLGILVLEVKGGGIACRQDPDGATWYSTDRHGIEHAIADPFLQARNNKYALMNYLKTKDRSKLTERCWIGYGVAFPDLQSRPQQTHGTHAPQAIVISHDDLMAPEKTRAAIERIFAHWNHTSRDCSRRDAEILKKHLLLNLKLPACWLRNDVEDAQRKLEMLTGYLAGPLQLLRSPGHRCACITGGAGTGKTVLAMARALDLAQEGRKVLILCFNEPLRDHIRARLKDEATLEMLGGITGCRASILRRAEVHVENFHGLVLAEAQKAGIGVPQQRDRTWYNETAPQILFEALIRTGTRYDAILIDEAQDFERGWLDALQLSLLADGGSWLRFADPRQNIYGRAWQMPGDMPLLPLFFNCRNAAAIARLVSAQHGGGLGYSPLAEGGKVEFIPVESGKEPLLEATKTLLQRLLGEEGLAPDQIMVISNKRDMANALQETRVQGRSLVPADRVMHDANGIAADTIHRIKGLESDVVLLVMLENPAMPEELEQSLVYVATSRARAALYVVGSRRFGEALGLGLEG